MHETFYVHNCKNKTMASVMYLKPLWQDQTVGHCAIIQGQRCSKLANSPKEKTVLLFFFYGASGRDSRQDSEAEIFERADFIDSPMASKQSDKSKRQ